MPNGSDCQETTFAYLSTLHSKEHGFFGGYLVLSKLGRPLEFHCTAPIQPSRAQQILYGPTLEPYLLGEQICGALLHAAKLKPAVILTNCEPALYVRSRSAAPIVLVTDANPNSQRSLGEVNHQSKIAAAPSDTGRFKFREYELQLPIGYDADKSIVDAALTVLTQHVELIEPFERIYEAIREAQRLSGCATDTNDQAA